MIKRLKHLKRLSQIADITSLGEQHFDVKLNPKKMADVLNDLIGKVNEIVEQMNAMEKNKK